MSDQADEAGETRPTSDDLPVHLPEGAEPGADELAGFAFGSLLGAAQAVQSQMLEAQQRLAESIVEGVAGGGAVRVIMSGDFEFQSVRIEPGAIDSDDPTLLEDLVLAALNDVMQRVAELAQQSNPLAGLGGDDLGGLDIGKLFGG
jgi:hypothetical protein